MQIFEFHFNPKLNDNLIFDSFCYEPENIYERKMGSLYMAGLLRNVLPKNLHFLERLQKLIKENYYLRTISTPEKSLKESLKEANEFLEGVVKRGDVSWLGNLNFAVISLKDFKLNFTKVGGIKIFLLRRGQVTDIDKKLRFQDIEPYPLKVFPNLVSGKLAENDLILVLTKEVSEFFQTEGILNEIVKFGRFSQREFKEILKEKREMLSHVSGICLAIVLTREVFLSKKEAILPQVKEEFSLKEVFSPIFKFVKRLKKPVLPKIPKIGALKPKLTVPKIKVEFNKNLILVLALILTLILGFLFAQLEERQKIKTYQKDLEEIEEKINSAEGFLILKTPKTQAEANSLLKEGWDKITPILKDAPSLSVSFLTQVFDLRDEILDKLYTLNKLEEIEKPELFFEFKAEKFIPQKFLVSKDNLYFFSPYVKNLFKLDKSKNEEIVSIDKKFNLASNFDDSILFFTKPNQLTILTDRSPSSIDLLEPYPDFNYDDFSTFKGNLYFFDKKAGQIVKYPYKGNFEWGNPEFWLKKSIVGKSIAVDGSVWVLEKNAISKYYAGSIQEKIEPDIFPQPEEFSKIFTSSYLPYLYILEPIQKRIIILDKAGQIIKQFQSESFDNLLDFGVSEDGKIIWLLNGMKVYQIEF